MPQYKNSFRSPTYVEQKIVDDTGTVIGTIRIKPSRVLWKPRAARKFYSVNLTDFADWITAPDAPARRTKS